MGKSQAHGTSEIGLFFSIAGFNAKKKEFYRARTPVQIRPGAALPISTSCAPSGR